LVLERAVEKHASTHGAPPRREIDALRALTGQDHGDRIEAWQSWWAAQKH
jgi:hypothetical protein